ncbi:hypothetical protein tinsulaeT_29980 [Thalassotalea insulae]|uniref:Uncharacterized protein n=1 Tax=Thalassotalea insulae TaxID=2056778 RepID=A0ABQ6GUP7_9GAMM|nr:hypothetical protein tinsulaeT_29980 [Thalassotalea insulae]
MLTLNKVKNCIHFNKKKELLGINFIQFHQTNAYTLFECLCLQEAIELDVVDISILRQ